MEFIKKHALKIQTLVCIVISYIATLALSLGYLVNWEQTGSSINLFKNLWMFSKDYTFEDIICFCAIFLFAKYVIKNSKKFDKWSMALALFFSVSYLVSQSYFIYNSAALLRQNNFQIVMSIIFILGYFFLFYLVLTTLFNFIDKITSKPLEEEEKNDFLHKHFFLVSFLVIFLSWMFWIILSYPGTFNWDGVSQLYMLFDKNCHISAHHPPLSTYIMGLCLVLGNKIHDYSLGVVLYEILHTVLSSFIFSLGINELYKNKIKLRYCLFITAFFAFTPFWGAIAQWFEKDLLYTDFITLFSIYLIKIFVQNKLPKKDLAILFVSGLLACLLRNNGIFAVAPSLFILILAINKKIKMPLILTLILTVCCFHLTTEIVYFKILKIERGSVAESLSIPFTQTARYIVNHPNDVTEYEKKVINSVLDYDKISTPYIDHPYSSNGVKETYHGTHKDLCKYFAVWFEMFFKHPGTYIGAYTNMYHGFAAPLRKGIDFGVDYDYENPRFIDQCQTALIKKLDIKKAFGRSISRFLSDAFLYSNKVPIFKYLIMMGLYSWIILLLISLLIRKRKYSYLTIFTPAIMSILVCMASPFALMRYALPHIVLTPILIGWVWYFLSSKEYKEK